MAWQDRLTRGQFRDFEFLTESHEATGGSRLVAHEFPGRDDPEVEDFGLKANGWRLNCYFIGPDYDLAANAFIQALRKPGAADLIHPWLGLLSVRAKDWTRSENVGQNSYCTITVEFIPAGGEQLFGAIDPVDQATASIAAFEVAAVEAYDPPALNDEAITAQAEEVTDHLENIRKIISVATLPLTWINGAINTIEGIKTDVKTFLGLPQQYANAISSLLGSLGIGLDDEAPSDTQRARAVKSLTRLATNPPAVAQNNLAINNENLHTARQQEATLRSHLALSAAMQLALGDYVTSNARDGVLNDLLTSTDALLPTLSDAMYQPALDMRTAVMNALSAQDLAAQQSRTVVNRIPAVVLAYQMQTNEARIIEVNNAKHPLFISGVIYA